MTPHVYTLAAFWQHSGALTKGTLVGLVVMALASWYVLGSRIWTEALARRRAETASTRFWTSPSLYEAVQQLERGSPFRHLAEEALEAAAHREGRLTDTIALDEWLEASLARAVAAAEHSIRGAFDFLAAIAATAPAIGLAAGLWAVGGALLAGVPATDGRIGAAAGEALAITAIGLAVALPASLGHRWLGRRNDAAIAKLRDFAVDMRAVLLSNDAALGSLDASRAVQTRGSGNRGLHGPLDVIPTSKEG